MKERVIYILSSLLLSFCISSNALGQSPRKYLENGFVETAFSEASRKQNRRVKLKQKHVDVILESYGLLYANHANNIASAQANWDQSYKSTMRVVKLRSCVTHPGVYNQLTNILYDNDVLDDLASKFNHASSSVLDLSTQLESEGRYEEAVLQYQEIGRIQRDALRIATLGDRITMIDHNIRIAQAKGRIGDQFISMAEEQLALRTKFGAQRAIDFINKARKYRPLSSEEEAMFDTAHVLIGGKLIDQARELLTSGTKQNARKAFSLIREAGKFMELNAEEESLLDQAQNLGTTHILVKMQDGSPVNTAQSFSGILNKRGATPWLAYHFKDSKEIGTDYVLEITENRPGVKLGDTRKRVYNNTRTVEYYEEVYENGQIKKDANGKPVKVKKKRLAIGVIAVLSRTKTANLDWSFTLKDPKTGRSVHSDLGESKIELTNEYASLVSGDILALPEDIETNVNLDSQPFPEDKDMLNQVTQLYISNMIQSLHSNGNLL